MGSWKTRGQAEGENSRRSGENNLSQQENAAETMSTFMERERASRPINNH